MFKSRLVFSLGLWVAILPFLGLPIYLKNILFVITGLIFIYISLVFYNEHKSAKNNNKMHSIHSFDNFSENRDFEKH